jgi:hypothetical protein
MYVSYLVSIIIYASVINCDMQICFILIQTKFSLSNIGTNWIVELKWKSESVKISCFNHKMQTNTHIKHDNSTNPPIDSSNSIPLHNGVSRNWSLIAWKKQFPSPGTLTTCILAFCCWLMQLSEFTWSMK